MMGGLWKEKTTRPVTPAMTSGWAPNTENTKAAMKEEIRTSTTPYLFVVSIKSRENAMPGRTLNGWE